MTAMGVDPEAAMQPFVEPFSAYHDRTAPKSWLEGLLKAYVGDGIAKEPCKRISAGTVASTSASNEGTFNVSNIVWISDSVGPIWRGTNESLVSRK
jgi:hypothetical protein